MHTRGLVVLSLATTLMLQSPMHAAPPRRDALTQFDIPDAWEERFWSDPGVVALRALDLKAVAALVPVQSGLRHCRCPACWASEADDALGWTPEHPDILTCRRCKAAFPNDKVPAKVDNKVPEEVVEVRPHVLHRYPYHAVPPEFQAYPDERLYLAAKRDDRVREFLAKAAFYAAVRAHERSGGADASNLSRLACVILLRFAQVYPSYAIHYDQPGEPKFFDRADLPPPYRRGYRTAKWDWSASAGIPLNLALAYARVRGSPALAEAGALLGDKQPARTIERELFRAASTFVRNQPVEASEASLQVDRGLLAVGRLLGDPDLVHDAVARLETFAERGFYHDGLWRDGDPAAQRRVVGLIDGWLDRLLAGYSDPPGYFPAAGRRFESLPGTAVVPMLALARGAERAAIVDPRTAEIRQTAWPAPPPAGRDRPARHPALLGGAGLARLAVGTGADALDLEVRGLGDLAGLGRTERLALRLAIGGRPVLGDLDHLPPAADGWDRASISHNTVAIDGLNQRETPAGARSAAPGANVLFFAAHEDFQVACLGDPYAYPRSSSLYRQTIVALGGGGATYAVALFEVVGGLQHDQFFHAAAGSSARWRASVPLTRRAASLLPPNVVFVPNARAEDGRWLVQAYGEFAQLSQGRADHPPQAILADDQGMGVRLHLIGDLPATLITAQTPDPSAPAPGNPAEAPGRTALIVRRRSEDGATLHSQFITVFEPLAAGRALSRVGRVTSEHGTVVLLIRGPAGDEHLVINIRPGEERTVRLADDRELRTDGFVVRIARGRVQLAGGTFAEVGGQRAAHDLVSGTIVHSAREPTTESRGWFQTAEPLSNAGQLAGRTLLVRHGDGNSRGWTIVRAESLGKNGGRLWVREEPGFRVDAQTGEGHAYQFPGGRRPGPHTFTINSISP
jgi:hypothetical protein